MTRVLWGSWTARAGPRPRGRRIVRRHPRRTLGPPLISSILDAPASIVPSSCPSRPQLSALEDRPTGPGHPVGPHRSVRPARPSRRDEAGRIPPSRWRMLGQENPSTVRARTSSTQPSTPTPARPTQSSTSTSGDTIGAGFWARAESLLTSTASKWKLCSRRAPGTTSAGLHAHLNAIGHRRIRLRRPRPMGRGCEASSGPCSRSGSMSGSVPVIAESRRPDRWPHLCIRHRCHSVLGGQALVPPANLPGRPRSRSGARSPARSRWDIPCVGGVLHSDYRWPRGGRMDGPAHGPVGAADSSSGGRCRGTSNWP